MDSLLLFWIKIKRVIALIRFKPFGVATPEERSQERHRRIFMTGGASVLARGISQLVTLAIVPLTLHYLGAERYGLWLTINSVSALLTFADLGLGNGLVNAISEANGLNNRRLAREYVSSAFFILSLVAVTLAIVFAVAYAWLDWSRIFNVKDARAVAEAGPAMAIFMICMLINIPLGVVQRVQLGYQQGFANSLWQALGTILSLGAVIVAIYFQLNLLWLVLALAGVPLLTMIGQGIIFFGFTHTWIKPSIESVNLDAARKILRLGGLFFVLQLAVALAYASDNMVAAQVLGPASVTQYGVPARLFGFISIVWGMLFLPLWPAYGEAITRGDVNWVKKTLIRSLWMALIGAGVPAVILVIFGPQIITLWVGKSVQPSFMLLCGLGVWNVLGTVGTALAMFLNGANVVKFQVIFALLMSVTVLISKIVMARTFGTSGIIWGTILPYVFLTLIPIGFYIPYLFRRMQRVGA